MGLFDRLRAAGGALVTKSVSGAAATPSQGFLPSLGGTQSATGMIVTQATALSVAAVHGCVNIRSKDVARCTPRLFRRDARGKKVEVTDHPVARVFRRPNDKQPWFEFARQLQTGLLLKENAYAVKRIDRRGKLVDMIPVNPDSVLVLEASDGQIFYQVNRIGLWQMAVLRDFPTAIAEEDVLHLRGLSLNSLVGLPMTWTAREAIGLAQGLEQQAARFIANGSRPSVILQAKKSLTKEVADRLRVGWANLTQGSNNTGNTVVLEEGMEAKPMQLTSVDLEHMAQRKFEIEEICRFYGVPSFKMGLTELRGINIDQINQDYVNNTIMPDLHLWEQKIDMDFGLSEQDLEVAFDETVLLRADITTRYTAARIALGGAAFVSVDEVRAGEGLPPADPDATGTAAITRPVNMATIGSDKTGTAPDGAGHPSAAEGGVPGADNVTEGRPIVDEGAAGKSLTAAQAAATLKQAGLDT